MLLQLTIHNLVIVDQMNLDFQAGFSVLTGETGAGKSILLDALGLTLGAKANPGLIRAGCDKAEIHSVFSLDDCPAAQAWLVEQDLAEEDQCILRRVLVRSGRSRAAINGRPVTQAMLQTLGEQLLQIHGQHAHQILLRQAAQRQLLDQYAQLTGTVSQLRRQYRIWQQARQTLADLQQAADERGKRQDYLRYQLDELEPVLEIAAQAEELTAEHRRLAHAMQLQTISTTTWQQIQGDDQSLTTQLGQVIQSLQTAAELDESLQPVLSLLSSADIQLGEAAQVLRRYTNQLVQDPQALHECEQQLSVLHDLARKHRTEPGQLTELAETLRAELQTLTQIDQQLDVLAAEVAQHEQTYAKQAQDISEVRQAAAVQLAQIVTDNLQTLGMQQSDFQVNCISAESGPYGMDQIRFLIQTNPGQPLAALTDVASGGELSRIALAIQVATSDCAQVPTLIFDEVDVGIGGAVADIVGQLLRRLGQRHQVVCVTHLAQVAAQGHQHYQVQKQQIRGVSQTRIRALTQAERVHEIARMLGGVAITEQTHRHAAEMIKLAQSSTTESLC
ncbi:MAG: DNA repair protein RecN [Pseudomonadota bacterium]